MCSSNPFPQRKQSRLLKCSRHRTLHSKAIQIRPAASGALMKSMVSNALIVCPLWDNLREQNRSRRYIRWDRACLICSRKVVVSAAVKQQLELDPQRGIVCDQCAMAQPEFLEEIQLTESQAEQSPCPVCERMQAQEISAKHQFERARGLPEAAELEKRWEHAFRAVWKHKNKAHSNTPRSR